MRLIISVIICCSAVLGHAQSPQQMEQDLLISFRRLQTHALVNDADPVKKDSVRLANAAFRNQLLTVTASARSTFYYEFPELSTLGLVISTSDDGLFRSYSWDTGEPGAEHHYDAVLQYRTDSKVFSQLAPHDEEATGRWYSRIYQLQTSTKTYYIGLYHEQHSSTELVQGVKLFCIEDGKLVDTVRLFKTAKGWVNELALAFDFLSVAHRPERPVKLIYYDSDDERLHLSVVADDGKVTNRFVIYQFNGEYFERLKVER